MKKVLLSCIALTAAVAMAVAQDPVYPSSLDLTLNGENELSGVTVSQKMKSGSLNIDIKGESDADLIIMEFKTPDGWDYSLVGSVLGSTDAPFLTRSSHWLPVSLATDQGYTEGNSLNFPVNGKEYLGTIYLAKGDNVWENPIDITCKLSKPEEPEEPNAVESIYATGSNTTYYDINGNKIANPAKGIYVKVADGKATKIIVK